MPPLRKMQTSALLSFSGPPCAATLLASLRLSNVLRIADEPTAAQFSCFKNPRREMGLLIALPLHRSFRARGSEIYRHPNTRQTIIRGDLVDTAHNPIAGGRRH